MAGPHGEYIAQNEKGQVQAAQQPHDAPFVTMFGIGLGLPLAIPECVRDRTTGYKFGIEALCYQRWDVRYSSRNKPIEEPFRTGNAEIRFPPSDRPAMGTTHIGFVIDGRLEQYTFFTLGIKYQELDLKRLIDKFGPPTSIDRSSVETRVGAKFEAIRALWKKEGYIVSFTSADDNIESGTVRVSTDAAVEFTKKASERQDSKDRQM
jgi:hypothetical protein